MARLKNLKWLVAVVLALVTVLVLALLLIAGDAALSILDRLAEYPLWVSLTFGGLVLVIALGSLLLTWRLLFRDKRRPARRKTPRATDPEAIRERLAQADARGAEVGALKGELEELKRRQKLPVIQVALSGRISAGKSSLINALLPGAEAMTSVIGGSTHTPERWRWRGPGGEQIELVDLPGTGGDDGDAELARAECVRSHVVVYVCDGDLTRQQMADIQSLQELDKPMLVAINKADQYGNTERTRIRNRIETHLTRDDDLPAPVVFVSAGGEEEVLRIDAGGRESRATRRRPTRIESLAAALEVLLAERYRDLEPLRERAVFTDVSQRLEDAEARFREAKAAALIDSHARQAVVGALAAITPGADLVIQGVLATRLISALGRLYEVPIGEVETDKLLRLAGGRLRNATSITLAIAGNGLKAFPGVGTIAGGLVHAVAYGMIFQSLGKAVASTLAERAQLAPEESARKFGELLDENLEPAAKRFARLALARRGKAPSRDR